MSVTLEIAATHLNIDLDAAEELTKLNLYVEGANEWIGARVTDTTPDAITTLATLVLLEFWWRSQRGPSTDVYDLGDDYVLIGGVGYAIPNRVRELLGPFLVRGTPTYSFPDATCWPDPAEWPA